MKTIKPLLYFALIVLSSSFVFKNNVVNTSADDIVGTWWNAEKNAKIRIFLAKNGKYAGKTEWMKEPNDANGNPKTDVNNPNPKLRNNPRLGLPILKNFEYNSKSKRWENGTLYDPNNGKTYDGYMYFEGNQTDKISLRGYVMGMTWLGRTSEWERAK